MADGSRGRRAHHASEGGEQAASLVLGAGSRESNVELKQGSTLKIFPSGELPPRPHTLQEGHTHSKKATPPNSAIPYGPSIQTHESVGAKPIHTIKDKNSMIWRKGKGEMRLWEGRRGETAGTDGYLRVVWTPSAV